jgi:hypothetical protein
MLTMNDLIAMLENLPKMLAAGWVAWLVFGLMLSVWGRREALMIDDVRSEHKSGVRAAAGSKPPSGVRAPVRASKNVPVSAGDAFGDLEKLLDQEIAGSHRMPGEKPSPVLAEVTVTASNGAALAAPQSLP